jgi:hypothetical protein
VVFTYIRVLVLEPSVLMYKEPCAAESVGAPDPKNTPKLVVEEISRPVPAVPPAGTVVPEYRFKPPVRDIEVPVATPKIGVTQVGEFKVGEVKVLLVKVSVVVLPTNVSVVVGKVSVPVFVIVEITGAVKILFVRVSVVVLATSVSVTAGRVNVPEAVAEACRTVEPLDDPENVVLGSVIVCVKVLVPLKVLLPLKVTLVFRRGTVEPDVPTGGIVKANVGLLITSTNLAGEEEDTGAGRLTMALLFISKVDNI